jgi:hypothetical protein
MPESKIESISIHENDYPYFAMTVELSDWNAPVTICGEYSPGVLPDVIGAGCGNDPAPDFRMGAAWVQAKDDYPLAVSLAVLFGYGIEAAIAEYLCKEGV